jgi:hypothetical protein
MDHLEDFESDFDSLRICRECDCRLAFESASTPVTADAWLVVLQCPNCWHAWSLTIGDAALSLLEYALDDDMSVIAAALEQLEYANAVAEAEQLEAEIARFSTALQVGAIWPMDF